jgi:hypothetical protein
VSQDARARPLAERAAFEAQIPTEVLRQDQRRRAVHHEGGADSTAGCLPAQNEGWSRPDSRSTTTALITQC